MIMKIVEVIVGVQVVLIIFTIVLQVYYKVKILTMMMIPTILRRIIIIKVTMVFGQGMLDVDQSGPRRTSCG